MSTRPNTRKRNGSGSNRVEERTLGEKRSLCQQFNDLGDDSSSEEENNGTTTAPARRRQVRKSVSKKNRSKRQAKVQRHKQRGKRKASFHGRYLQQDQSMSIEEGEEYIQLASSLDNDEDASKELSFREETTRVGDSTEPSTLFAASLPPPPLGIVLPPIPPPRVPIPSTEKNQVPTDDAGSCAVPATLPRPPLGIVPPPIPPPQIPMLCTEKNHRYFSHIQTGHLWDQPPLSPWPTLKTDIPPTELFLNSYTTKFWLRNTPRT